jgi:hypothetical protein
MLNKIKQSFNPEEIDLEEHELVFATSFRKFYRNIRTEEVIVSPTNEQFLIQTIAICFSFIVIGTGIFFIDKYTFIRMDYIIIFPIISIACLYSILAIFFCLWNIIGYFTKKKCN